MASPLTERELTTLRDLVRLLALSSRDLVINQDLYGLHPGCVEVGDAECVYELASALCGELEGAGFSTPSVAAAERQRLLRNAESAANHEEE